MTKNTQSLVDSIMRVGKVSPREAVEELASQDRLAKRQEQPDVVHLRRALRPPFPKAVKR